MNRTELHPVELLVLAGIALAWAIATAARLLLVPLLALVALTPRRPAPPPAAPVAAAPAPAMHPLALLSEPTLAALQPLTVTDLRRRARAAGLPRCLSRSGRRDALLQALAGLEVAAV